MAEHTVKAYEQELSALEENLQRMGEIALDQVNSAIHATVSADPALAQQVIDRDAELDVMEAHVDLAVVRLMALRQPLGSDLRNTVTAIKIASNLERVGDLAKSIGKRVIAMSMDAPAGIPTGSIERLGQTAAERLRLVLKAAADQDPAAADAVWAADRDVDEQYESLFREMLTYMMGSSEKISAGAHLLFAAKNLERIGDHATNIAEELHFKFTGEPKAGSTRPKLESA